MQVRATSEAFYGGRRVRVGDVIDVPDTFKASWGTPVPKVAAVDPAPPKAPPKAPRKRETIALSQVAREKAAGPLDDLV